MASASRARSPWPTKEASSNSHPYPLPLAKYDDVAASPKLFMDTLEKLHASIGTKFMIPIIGGKDLDLHRLFVEVTSRGGIERVIRERRWKEVTAVFNFPCTATNASFVLRKYYFSLLHHYEQIYFFKARVWVPISSDSLTSPTLTPVPIQRTESLQPTPEIQAAKDKYCRIGWRSIIDAEGILYAWTLLKRLGVLYAAAWFFLHGFDLISKSLEEGGEPGKKELLEGVLS